MQEVVQKKEGGGLVLQIGVGEQLPAKLCKHS
jgi:hypothetical protein